MTQYRHTPKPSHDTSWQAALGRLKQGDGKGAAFLYSALAKDGCGAALTQLGRIYEFGVGNLEPDHEVAVEWYKRSVETIDDVGSHLALARIYLQTDRFDPDNHLALYHLRLLEKNDVAGAVFTLGLLYENGVGVERSLSMAREYYMRATNLGHILARVYLTKLDFEAKPLTNLLAFIRARCQFRRLQRLSPNDPRLGIDHVIQDSVYIPDSSPSVPFGEDSRTI